MSTPRSTVSTPSPGPSAKKRPRTNNIEERPTARACRVTTSSDLILSKADQVPIDKAERYLWYTQYRCYIREEEALRGPFNFTGLPRELRESVYAFVFRNTNDHNSGSLSYDLALSEPPNITKVSRFALRQFYITGHFEVNIHCTFFDESLPYAAVGRSGILNMKKSVKAAIRDAGDLALFRHVTMFISKASNTLPHGAIARHSARFLFELKFERGRISCNIRPREFHRNPESDASENLVLDEAQLVVAGINSRERFKGLTLKDLETIARVFRA